MSEKSTQNKKVFPLKIAIIGALAAGAAAETSIDPTIVQEQKNTVYANHEVARNNHEITVNSKTTMKILNGKILLRDNNTAGNPPAVFKDPIAYFPVTEATPIDSDALENQMVGYRAFDKQGKVKFVTMKFRKEDGMTYESDNPSSPVLTVEAYTNAGKNDHYVDVYVFDPAMKQTLTSPDGKPVIPGYLENK